MTRPPSATGNASERAALLASAALCRLMARLDTQRVPEFHEALVQLVSKSMHAIYGARCPGASSARRSNGASSASHGLGQCLALLQAHTLAAPAQEVLSLTAQAASAVYALEQAAMAERGGAGDARQFGGMQRDAPSALAGLEWSRGAAAHHTYERPPILPSAEEPTDESPDASKSDLDDGSEEVPLESLPAMPLDALRALSESFLAEDDAEANDFPKEEAAAPHLSPSPPPERQQVESYGDALLDAHLSELADAFDRRQSGLAEDATWTDLERLERTLLARADAVAWLGAGVVDSLARGLAAAEQSRDAFAAALPLLCIDGIDATDAVLRAAERGNRDAVDGLTEAILLACNQEAADRLLLLLEGTANPATRLLAARVMAAREGLGDHYLERLLVDSDPAVVTAAVGDILRCGKAYALPRLEYMASCPLEDPAAAEVLVAASVMGSRLARRRLRARLRAGSVSDRLVMGLAACGDEQDVAALAELALAGGPLARPAVVALGWLGSGQALAPLRELAADGAFAEEAITALAHLLGAAADVSSRALGPGRWWAGAPWSVNAPARLLAAEDTGALWREFAFLELVARTGQHIPFSPSWSVARQRTAAASWSRLAERLTGRIAQGSWLHQGQPGTQEIPA